MDSERLKTRMINNRIAYQAIGVMLGEGTLSPRQTMTALKEWKTPSHEEFSHRNAWSLLNACTESLKSAPPLVAMEKHAEAYRTIIDI
jgi:hypothetical protein